MAIQGGGSSDVLSASPIFERINHALKPRRVKRDHTIPPFFTPAGVLFPQMGPVGALMSKQAQGTIKKHFSKQYMRNRKKDNAEPYVRDALLIWLDPDMHWHGVASGKRGRSVTFSDTAVEFCLAVKNLFGLPLRDAVPLARKLLLLAELNWSVPDFSTVSRRRKRLRDVTAGLSVPPGLHLLIDDSGIRIMGEGEWECRARGNNCARQWRKLQLIIKDQ